LKHLQQGKSRVEKALNSCAKNISTADKPTPSRLLTVIAKDKKRKEALYMYLN